LNYFFGGNGPGPISASTIERTASAGPISSGRDIGGTDANLQAGLLAGKRNNSSPAFDMKSLGRHIEAVCPITFSYALPFYDFSPVQTSSDGTPHLSAREELETSLIRSLIASYFDIVRQSIQDLVPKAVMHLLVNHTSQQVQTRLVSSLYKPDLFGELLNEDEALVAERARVKALLDAYKEAFKTLSEVSLKST
jgi:dynamin 1-like protein